MQALGRELRVYVLGAEQRSNDAHSAIGPRFGVFPTDFFRWTRREHTMR